MIVENKNTHALPDCLKIPIGVQEFGDLEAYVGEIIEASKNQKWAIIAFEPLKPPNALEVWNHPRGHLLAQPKQCWVHVDYTGYRKMYAKCFPGVDLRGLVVDHIRNRRFARQTGFNYVRLIHVSRSVNSSSGRGEEYDVINYKNPEGLEKFNPSTDRVDYADPADLLKMLNEKVGAFPLNNLRDKLHLFYG